jgi:fatty-acyl-CoA synthase
MSSSLPSSSSATLSSAPPVAGTIRAQLQRLAAEHGDRPAIVFGDETVTYRDLEQRCLAFARSLDALGLDRGDRVAGLLPNSVDWLVAYLGTAASGRIFVGLNTWFGGPELTYVLRKCGARVLLTTGAFRSHDYAGSVRSALGPDATTTAWNGQPGHLAVQSADLPDLGWIVQVGDGAAVTTRSCTLDELLAAGTAGDDPRYTAAEDEPALIVYTSGSTGLPKGVVLCQGPLLRNGWHIGERQHVQAEDRLWITSPLFFSYGCANAVMVVLSHGSTLLLQDYFNAADAIEFMAREQATVYYATTNMTYAIRDELAREPRPLSLRTGTAIGTPAQLRAAIDLVPGACNIYGMTETYGNCTVTDADDPVEVRATTQGRPLPEHVIVIVDPETEQAVGPGELGEVRVGGLVTPGYFNDAERTAQSFDAEGRLRTGDLGRLDAAGRLVWESRIGDLIKTSGVNVSAAEVERVLESDPRVQQVYVVGLPDEARGELIAAVVQPAGDSLTADDVVAFARDHLTSYKVPRLVFFRPDGEFPLTSTGKVSRRDLVKEVEADRSALQGLQGADSTKAS